MPRIRTFAGAFLLGVSIFFAGCTDVPTAPSEEIVDPSYGLLGLDGLLSSSSTDATVRVLERSVPLAEDEVVTRTIGPRGGSISLPEAGLTVAFPRHALRSNTEITVRAPAGNLVGYHFEPHGIQFQRPVTVVQDLELTRLLDSVGLEAVYFEGELEPEVNALETITLWLLRTLGVFTIDHFSGYVIATN